MHFASLCESPNNVHYLYMTLHYVIDTRKRCYIKSTHSFIIVVYENLFFSQNFLRNASRGRRETRIPQNMKTSKVMHVPGKLWRRHSITIVNCTDLSLLNSDFFIKFDKKKKWKWWFAEERILQNLSLASFQTFLLSDLKPISMLHNDTTLASEAQNRKEKCVAYIKRNDKYYFEWYVK